MGGCSRICRKIHFKGVFGREAGFTQRRKGKTQRRKEELNPFFAPLRLPFAPLREKSLRFRRRWHKLSFPMSSPALVQRLTTKLYLPPARQTLVERPVLLDQLKDGLRGRLTLVSAPAGFGKT